MGKVYEQVKKFHKKYSGGVVWRLKKHAKVIEEYINPQERILYAFAAQKNKSISEIFNTYVIVLTSKRILMGHKRLLWGSYLYSITPDLYNDLQVYKGLIWGKITIDTVKEKVILTNLAKRSLDEIETAISEFMMTEKQKYKNTDK